MRDDAGRFGEAGAGVVLVGLGDPAFARGFCADRAPGCECVVQPDRSAHRAFGLRRGTVAEVLGPANWGRWVRNQVTGLHQGRFGQGDPAQLPGTFVVDVAGIVRFAHRARRVSDIPANEEILAALVALRETS